MSVTQDTISTLKEAYISQIAGERLLLPTIQRSFVWSNERIVDYWDTLARGWFPGLFMVRLLPTGEKAYNVSGKTAITMTTFDGDREIFDGQQRMSTMMLGFGYGRLARSHKIWIGLSVPDVSGARSIKFRVTTLGQPFGYQINKPNEKLELHARREAHLRFSKQLKEKEGGTEGMRERSSLEVNKTAFEQENADILIGGDGCNWYSLVKVLAGELDDASDLLRVFRERIETTKILLRHVTDDEFLDYDEFFRRIGQGGVRLTDEELTYALMNRQFPALRPLIEKMLDNVEIGRLSSPTDIALGLFRLARVDEYSVLKVQKLHEWERANRPNPDYFKQLEKLEAPEALQEEAALRAKAVFESWINDADESRGYPAILLKDVRSLLLGQEGDKASPIMLARVDRYVIDIAMLLCHHEFLRCLDLKTRSAFCYWVIFFAESENVASRLAAEVSTLLEFDKDILKKVIGRVTRDKKSTIIPTTDDLGMMRKSIEGATALMMRAEWFRAADSDSGRRPSEIFDQLRFWTSRGKNLLLWVQRHYLNSRYPDFDPTSDRDEDLPVDLDHIIASARFGFRWGGGVENEWQIALQNKEQLKIFREARGELGNLIGNLRWLDSGENRGRGKGGGENDIRQDDETLIPTGKNYAEAFHCLSAKLESDGLSGWSGEDLKEWQKTVLLRTVDLVETCILEWGVHEFISAQSE